MNPSHNPLLPRSLFARLLLAFVVATVLSLIGFAFVNYALRDNPLGFRFFIQQSRLANFTAQLLAEKYEVEGRPATEQAIRTLEQQTRLQYTLFDIQAKPIAGRSPSVKMGDAAIRALRKFPRQAIQVGFRDLTSTYTVQTERGNRFVLVGQVPGGFLANLYQPLIRTLTSVAIVVLVCYLLARSLTTPLKSVQFAARRLAAGDLSARAGTSPDLRGRHDEIAELGRDFDTMAERLEAAIAAQRRLIADISHELRSPLARLNVALELARQKAGDSATPSLGRIERETERMNSLIGELLTLSRLESHGRIGDPQPVSLAELLGDVIADADFEAQSRGCSVESGIEGEVTLSGDEELLRRALENIIRNAVRYTEEGTAVQVSLVSSSTETKILIRDHGPGVPDDALAHLFRPFYRVADDRDRATGGIGLGLSIAERAISLHGGSVSATNASEGGLLVTITLPMQPN